MSISDTVPGFMKHPFQAFSSPQVAYGFKDPMSPGYSMQSFGQTSDVAT